METATTLVDTIDGGLDDDLDALFHHLAGQRVAHVVVEAAQDLRAAVDQRDLAAEAVEDTGEFDRDVAAARNHYALRQLLQVEGVVGGDAMLPRSEEHTSELQSLMRIS